MSRTKDRKGIRLEGPLLSIGALILALAVAAIVILIAGYDPFESYAALLTGAFSSVSNIATTLGTATPLIFAGLSVSLAYRAGFLNVAVESQLLVGALTAALVGLIPNLPAIIHVPLCLLAAGAAGGALGVFSAFLKRKLQVSELIITVMLNYIVSYLVEYLVSGPFAAESRMVRTNAMQESARIPLLIPNNRLSAGIFLAIASAVFLWWLLERTRVGYEMRACGFNPPAAEAGGIPVYRRVYLAMLVSGALAAFGGAVEAMGVHGYYINSMVSGYGYDGLTIAIMGNFSPGGCMITSLLFGALRAGSSNMNRSTNIPGEFITVLQALVILFVSTPRLILFFQKFTVRPAKKEG